MIHVKDENYVEKKNSFTSAFNDFIKFLLKLANPISLIIIGFSVYFYILSLKGCPDGQAICLKNLNEGEVRSLGSFILYSAALASFIIIGSLYKIISIYTLLLMSMIFGYLCFHYDTGADLESHGAYNRALLIVEIILFVIFLNFLILVVFLLKKCFKSTIIILIFLNVCGYYSWEYKKSVSCDRWLYGLNNVMIDNNHDTCKIAPPKVCYIDIFSGWFDYAGWLGENCEVIRGDDKFVFLKYLNNKNFKKIGFPPTQVFSHFPESKYMELQKNVLNNLFDFDDPEVTEEMKENLEIIVDYSDPYKSKIEMQMLKDEETVDERRKLYENALKSENKPLAKNFLYVYIDSLSRTHFHRKLPKLTKYLEKYYQNDNSKFKTYQFLRVQNVGYFTNINMIPVWFGIWWLDSGGKYYITSFKENGFMTGQALNNCGRGIFDFDTDDHSDLNWDDYDHENIAMFCDPNYYGEDNPYTPFLGAYSMKRRCLHGKDTSQHVIDYTELFWRTYKDEAKAFRMAFLDAHEGTGEIVKYLDDKLVDFFTRMESENLLDDTVVLFMADHGMNMPGVVAMLNGEDHSKEKYNPFLFLMVPNQVSKIYDFNLSDNEQEMITMWDIRNTILHIAGDSPELELELKGTSLFNRINSSERTCEEMKTREDYCICHK